MNNVLAPPAQKLFGELLKLPAFFRRDFIVAWSYRFGLHSTGSPRGFGRSRCSERSKHS